MLDKVTSKTLHICYITDEAYLKLTEVSMYSIIRRKDPDTTIKFHVIGNRLNQEQVNTFKAIGDVEGVGVVVNLIDSNQVLKSARSHYLKFLIPETLSLRSVDKVLYIDGDLFARKDISTVYHTDLDGYSIGMVKDAAGVICKDLEVWPRDEYFHKDFFYNSGLILMDLNKLRENKTHIKWINHIDHNRTEPPFDQAIINYINHYDCKALPLQYQFPYHNLIRYDYDYLRKVEKWNQYYGTHYSTMKEMVDASYFWHFYESKSQLRKDYPLIDKIFTMLFNDYDEFVSTGIVKPWEPKDDSAFYINPEIML